VRFSPDGREVATGGDDGAVRVWNAETLEERLVLRGSHQRVSSVAWRHDGLRLASAGVDGLVRIWDLEKGTELVAYYGYNASVHAIAWRRDGRDLAAAGGDGRIRIWDAVKGEQRKVLSGHTLAVHELAYSADGRRLASAGEDGAVKIWDATTDQEIWTTRGTGKMHGIDWSLDGTKLAIAGEDAVLRIFDAATAYRREASAAILPAVESQLQIEPLNTEALQLRARILARQGNWDGAAAEFDRVAELAHENRPRWFDAGWWRAGPFDENLSAICSAEQALDPCKSEASTTWRPISPESRGFVDLEQMSDPPQHVSNCVLIRLYAPTACRAVLLVGADDGVRVWLNGNAIHEHLAPRSAAPESDAVPVEIRAGWNSVVARVANVTGLHCLYFEVSDRPLDLARAPSDCAD
jgi:WD40 repeat protein